MFNTTIIARINEMTTERERLVARIAEIDGMLGECRRDMAAVQQPAPATAPKAMKPSVIMYTDGSCSGNPGPGGWGVVLEHAGKQKTISGGDQSTTNNRMELTAVIQGLSALKTSCAVDLRLDSRYVGDAISKGWLAKWLANGWRKADKKPVENTDLWKDLVSLLNAHEVRVTHVDGHTGNPGNELADRLATAETAKLK